MAEVVNLRRERKRSKRRDAEQEAAAKRLLHGRPQHLHDRDAARRDQESRTLDGHKLVTGDRS
ncbi:MAG: DUF4169 family protein [Proteobacteria bacterium]|nr:DUF4169 family protein [Pseudomonadota bacterium]